MKIPFPRKHLSALLLCAGALSAPLILTGCSSGEEQEAKYLERARSSFESGDYEKSRIDTKNVLQINAGNANARLLLARLEEREQNWPQMYANLSAAVAADPTLIEARIKLAELLVASNELEKAAEQIDAAVSQEPENTEVLAARAGLLFREGKMEDAENICLRVLELTPGHVTATGLLVAINRQSDPSRALSIVDDALRLHPDSHTLQRLRIQVLIDQNDVPAIIAAHEKLIEQHPSMLIYPVQLTGFLSSHNRLDEAEVVLRGALHSNPDSAQAKLVLVDFLANKRDPKQALELLEQFSSEAPENFQLRMALAKLYIATNQLDKAEATLRYPIEQDGKSAEAIDARNQLTLLELAQGRREAADALIAENLKIEPENGEALLIRARLLLADNDADAAIADLRTVIKGSPNSVSALELLAVAQERNGAASLALDTYQRLLQVNGNNLTALVGAARLLKGEGKLDDALKLLRQANAIAPGNPDITRALVDILSIQGDSKLALESAQTLLLKQETAAAGHYLSGLVLSRQKNYPAAIKALDNALKLEPRGAEPLQLLIRVHLADGHLEEAVAYTETHLQAHPQQVHAREFLAALYKQQNKMDKAETLLRKIIEENPGRTSAYRELAAVYIATNRRHDVETVLNAGLQRTPGNIGLMLMRAEVQQSLGKKADALATYDELSSLMPTSNLVKNNLAALLIDEFLNEENLRRAELLTADFARSDNPAYIDTLAWLQYRKANYAQAISLLESVVEKSPAPQHRFHLGMAYLRNNMPGKAREQLAMAIVGDTQFLWRKEAEDALSELHQAPDG